MIHVLRCPKCDHGIISKDEFVKTITERINSNLTRIKKADPGEQKALLQENTVYLSYMKEVLHHQYELKRNNNFDSAMLRELIWYCKMHNLVSDDELGQLRAKAKRQQKQREIDISKNLERTYSRYHNRFFNWTMPDPTANQAINNVMRDGKGKPKKPKK